MSTAAASKDRKRRRVGAAKSPVDDAEVDGADGTNDMLTSSAASASASSGARRKFAMVCSSNMNRSMEAHKQLDRKGLQVSSYGVGTMVRLPAPQGQLAFAFGTPYREILNKINEGDNAAWYRQNGLLAMIERNVQIKEKPERWQAQRSLAGKFDVVFCFEERVFDALMEDVTSRDPEDSDEPHAMHVINLEVVDNAEEAVVGAQIALELCMRADAVENLEDELPIVVEDLQKKYKRSIMHSTVYL